MMLHGLEQFWVNSSLNAARYHLHELGLLGDENKFRNISLYELIISNAPNGSFEVVNLVASYLKLANHEAREIDISSLEYSWSMYYEHKDYSVATIDDALITFEDKELFDERQSFKIISDLMEQSDKGISHLLTSYVNKKGVDYVGKINEMGYFRDNDYRINFWDLNPENYDVFDNWEVVEMVMRLLGRHYRLKTIQGEDIRNIMASKHMELFLYGIKKYDYSILSPDEDLILNLKSNNVKYVGMNKAEEPVHVPLTHGYIYKKDFEYIAEQKLGYLEIASYANGRGSCLPYIDVFRIYKKEDIQKDYKNIIHKAMFARVSDNDYIGNWYLLIGNILLFLMQYEIDVDWKKLYGIFNDFLKLSLICDEGK